MASGTDASEPPALPTLALADDTTEERKAQPI